MTQQLDETDLTILRTLQKDCRVGLEQLAHECALCKSDVVEKLVVFGGTSGIIDLIS